MGAGAFGAHANVLESDSGATLKPLMQTLCAAGFVAGEFSLNEAVKKKKFSTHKVFSHPEKEGVTCHGV